jgi:hypothetical protein
MTSFTPRLGDGNPRDVGDRLSEIISIMDFIPVVNQADILDYSSTDDVSSYVQDAIDALHTNGGGGLQFPPGRFNLGDVQLKSGISLIGSGRVYGGAAGVTYGTQFVAIDSPCWMIDTPTDGATNAGLFGINLFGDDTCGGLRFRDNMNDLPCIWNEVSDCFFTGFGKQAILAHATASKFINLLVVNSLKDRTPGALAGAIEITHTDNYLANIESSVSLTAEEGADGIVNETTVATFTGNLATGSATISSVSSTTGLAAGQRLTGSGVPAGARIASVGVSTVTIDVPATATANSVSLSAIRMDLYLCAILLSAANNFAVNCVGEISERGIHSTDQLNQLVNCRADLNFGHGFSGTATATGCKALNNSQGAANTYDGFSVTGDGGLWTGCRAVCATDRHRFGMDATETGGDQRYQRHAIDGFRSDGHGIAEFNQFFYPHSYRGMEFEQHSVTLSATPDVTGIGTLIPVNSSPVTVTNFLGGFNGREIRLLGNANVTIAHDGGQIITSTGANIALKAGHVYTFRKMTAGWANSAWVQVDKQAAAQANSAAAVLATLVTDFNGLLGKLRDAGLLSA